MEHIEHDPLEALGRHVGHHGEEVCGDDLRALPAGVVDALASALLFGLPGSGKTHVACAIGHEFRLSLLLAFVPLIGLVLAAILQVTN